MVPHVSFPECIRSKLKFLPVIFLKKIFLFFLILSPLPLFAQNEGAVEMFVSGIYQGRNLTVLNPSVADRMYCTNDVFVNNRKTMSNISASVYEISLSFLQIGDSVTVLITHKNGCQPKVLNPQALRPNPTFHFVAAAVNEKQIHWTTQGEKEADLYFVEHFSNQNWLTLHKIIPDGTGVYSVPVRHNPGLNRYRVRYVVKDGLNFYSREVSYKMPEPQQAARIPVTFYPRNVTDKIYLSRPAAYQVLSAEGVILKKGNQKEILLSDLKTGIYTLVIENKYEKFFKK